jgi:cytochrome c oxidase subunit 2
VYHIFCAEYCGTKHSAMIGKIYVQTPEEYQQWLSGAPAGEAPEVAGQKLFESLRCNTCHMDAAGAPGARGPSLVGLFGKRIPLRDGGVQLVDEDYLRESIVKPMAKITAGFDPIMPTYEGQVGEEQILQLIAYIKSLRAP